MQVSLPGTRYPIERQVAFQQELLTAIRQLPGVDSAGAASGLPVIGAPRAGTRFHRLSTPIVPPTQMSSATIRVVAPGYFQTLRIPVLRGREFTHADDANPTPGFIVNQEFVDRYLPNVDPLRESLMVRMRDENPYAPIIGVVGNVGEGSMRGAPRPTIFYGHSQLPLGPTLFVRTDRPVAMAEAVTSVIRRMDPNLVIRNVRMFEEAVAESLAQERLTALVSGAFAVSGLLLASLGPYALLAFMVTERTREIGLRIALGAQGTDLTWSVVRDGLRLVAIGAAAGVALSLAVLPLFGTLLFGVKPTDLTTYGVVLTLLAAVAGLASYVPARRAARVAAVDRVASGVRAMTKIRWPFVTQKRDDDMSQEMAFHIESTTRELVRGGMSERDARLEARRRFGSVLKQKEAGHEIRGRTDVSKTSCATRASCREGCAGARLHARRHPHARAGHRRQHRHLLRRRSAAAASAALSEGRRAGDGLRTLPDFGLREPRHRAHAPRRLPRQLARLAA